MEANVFDYDNQMEFGFQEYARQELEQVTIQDISYNSPIDGRVPAYIARRGDGVVRSVLLFMHPAGISRNAFLNEAVVFAENGAAALLIDAPYARRPRKTVFSFTEQDRADLRQNVIDLRRGIDLLLWRFSSRMD